MDNSLKNMFLIYSTTVCTSNFFNLITYLLVHNFENSNRNEINSIILLLKLIICW